MTAHRWGEPDKDGVRACLRDGCTVRVGASCAQGEFWQLKKGGHWHHPERRQLPPCTGTDAPEATATHPTAPCRHCGGCSGRHSAACALYVQPETTPSPLEVVRKALETFARMGGTVWEAERKMASDSLSALATLEASIRADEREACAKELSSAYYTVAAKLLRASGKR